MKSKDFEEEVVKTEFSKEKKEKILLRKNSETNIRTVTLADFHKQDFSKFLVLPKRRADSNSVYSFGLKYSINKEKHIVKELKNDNYFKFDFNILRNRIKNDINLREKLLKRIILNKNLKKKFALLEKPFPLLNRISNCKSVNKSEDFLMSIIMNHKFDIGEELLMELIEIRKNKQFDTVDYNKQKSHLLKFTNNKLIDKIEQVDKNTQTGDINNLDFKNSIINKRKRTVNPEKNNEESEEENYNINLINLNKENLDSSRNRITFNFSECKESKENGSFENNKNDFFLISSNFDKIKTNRRFNKRKKPKEEINRSQKHEQELIKSLDFDFEKQKYEMNNCNNKDSEHLKKHKEIFIFNGNTEKNLFSNLENNNNVINNNNNIQISNHKNKNNKVLFTNSKIARNTSLKNLNQGHTNTNINLEKNSFNHLNFNNNSIINNLSNNNQNNHNSNEESLIKTKISIRNVSTFNSKFNIQNFIKKEEKDDSKSRFYESMLDKTENFMTFQKYGNKTVSTENDFRNFNKNALNKILDSKRNISGLPKQFNKPNFIKYKFPEENNKPVDLELEKIKSFVSRKNKSSQIKSRVLGVQQEINNSIFNRFKQQTEVSNIFDKRNNNFLFDSNLANLVNIRLLSHNNISEGEIVSNNKTASNKKLISNSNSFKKSIYLSNKSNKKITSNNFFNIQHKEEQQVSANLNENENYEADASFNGISNNNTNSNILKVNFIKKNDNFKLLHSQKKNEIIKNQTARNKFYKDKIISNLNDD